MKAVVIEKQGGVENLVYREWPDPEPGNGDVVVRVRAMALNYLDIFVRVGMPGLPVPVPFISGGDIAGEIAQLGSGVDGWQIGERVAVNPATPHGMMGEHIQGGMAELVLVPATHLIRIHDNLGFEEAAAVPITYGTARRMLLHIANLRSDELILILGASGGVGIACVQYAKMIGARVIAATGSAAKAEKLLQIGADWAVDCQRQDFSAEAWRISEKRGVDVAINFTGGDTWVPTIRAMRRRGRLVTCGATAGFDPKTDLRYIWKREIQILGSNGYSQEDIARSLELVAEGRLKPVIGHRFPLSEAREAERLMEERSLFGKIVLVP